jgi:carboxymethylenebutenolidase
MGENIELTAADGHRLSAYLAKPAGTARGGMVIVQEIFGVTKHIRDVADQYAQAGYLSIAPAMFDRVERNVDLAYTDTQAAVGYMQKMKNDEVLLDLRAALDAVRSAGKVGVVGYCWGGTMAYLAAANLDTDAAIAYYGGGIDKYLAHLPKSPTMFHYGEQDTHIPKSASEQVKAAIPGSPVYLYPAGHGFNCNDRASYDAPSAKLAFERSLEFLHRHVG